MTEECTMWQLLSDAKEDFTSATVELVSSDFSFSQCKLRCAAPALPACHWQTCTPVLTHYLFNTAACLTVVSNHGLV
jgi:hypothetical protein